MKADSELSTLRRQMAAIRPGALTGTMERAAPVLAKALGYAELVRTFLPARPTMAAPAPLPAPQRRVAEPPPVRLPPTRSAPPRNRHRWRNRLLGFSATLLAGAGLGAYVTWRITSPSVGKPLRLLWGPRTRA